MAQNENIKNKLIQNLLKKGNKEQIEKKFKTFLFQLKQNIKQKPNVFFSKLLDKNKPKFTLKKTARFDILKIIKKKNQFKKISKLIAKPLNLKFLQKNNKDKTLINTIENDIFLKKKELYMLAEKIKYNKIHKK